MGGTGDEPRQAGTSFRRVHAPNFADRQAGPRGRSTIPMSGLLTRGSRRSGNVFPCSPSTVTGAQGRRCAARSPLTVAGPCGNRTHFPESSGAMLSAGSIALRRTAAPAGRRAACR